jgi:hypothetical protein
MGILFIITWELRKLTEPRVPENLGLKTTLSQIISPKGTDWLLKCVEKQTLYAYGVMVGIIEVAVLVVGGGGGGVDVIVLVVGGGGGVDVSVSND